MAQNLPLFTVPQELNVHSLRHTAASLMIAGGTDVATVAGILGHSQPSTTLDIYTHAFDKNKKAASAGLIFAERKSAAPKESHPHILLSGNQCVWYRSYRSNAFCPKLRVIQGVGFLETPLLTGVDAGVSGRTM